MNGKTLAIAGALTLGLLAPAGAAVAATNDDHPSPLGNVLNVFGDHDRKNDKKSDNKKKNDRKDDNRFGRKHSATFVYSGTIRSVDTGDRTITVGHGERGGDTKKVHVDSAAKIWRDGDEARLSELRKGDHVRMSGDKKDSRWTAQRVRAVS